MPNERNYEDLITSYQVQVSDLNSTISGLNSYVSQLEAELAEARRKIQDLQSPTGVALSSLAAGPTADKSYHLADGKTTIEEKKVGKFLSGTKTYQNIMSKMSNYDSLYKTLATSINTLSSNMVSFAATVLKDAIDKKLKETNILFPLRDEYVVFSKDKYITNDRATAILLEDLNSYIKELIPIKSEVSIVNIVAHDDELANISDSLKKEYLKNLKMDKYTLHPQKPRLYENKPAQKYDGYCINLYFDITSIDEYIDIDSSIAYLTSRS